MRLSSANTSRRPRASSATRSQIPPTARQLVRISAATALADACTASHAAWSSKGRGEPRAVARPGHGGDDDAMAPTRHARRLGLNVGEDHAEIQRAPAPATLAPVIARTAPPADPAAAALGRAWTDADHDRVTVEQNVLDHDPRQPEQPRPYPYPAHVAPPPRWIPDLTSRNPRSAAACATPAPPLRRARVRNLTPPHQRSRPALSSTANALQHAYRLASRHPPPKRCLTVAGQRS